MLRSGLALLALVAAPIVSGLAPPTASTASPPLTCADLAGRTAITYSCAQNADPSDCDSYFKWKGSGVAKLCYGPVDGKTTCSSTQVEGCPPPLTCADLAGRTEVAKCKKADTDDCAASFYWMDESSGLARLCYGPEDGETKCSDTKVEGCTSPTASPTASPTVPVP